MRIKGFLPYGIVLLFLVWCAIALRADLAQISFAPVWAARNAVLLTAFLSLINYVLRFLRWQLFLGRLGHSLPVVFSGLTYFAGFAFTLSPGKVGEMVRGTYYQKRGVPMSSTAAAFFVERAMDLLAMLSLALLAFASSTMYGKLMWTTLGMMAAVLMALVLIPWARITNRMHAIERLPGALRTLVEGAARTLISAKSLLAADLITLGFLIGLIAWGAEGLGLMVIGEMCPEVALDWSIATGIYATAIIVGALSFLPGGLGSTEAVMVALLAAHGFAMPDAILLTLVCRLLTLWLSVALGWCAVIALRRGRLPGMVSR